MTEELVDLFVEGYGSYRVRKGENLGRFLASKGILPLPCGGNGLCGLCRVFVKGRVSPPSPIEKIRGFTGNVRLACQTYVIGDSHVRILYDTKYFIGKISSFSINVDIRDLAPIYSVKSVSKYPIRYSRKRYFLVKPKEGTSCNKVVELLNISTCIRDNASKALLVDLGTTKIAYQVYNEKAELIKESIVLNPLQKYGSDIITRATKALEDEKVYSEMQELLRKQIYNIALENHSALIAIAGNSIMESIFLGLPLNTLVEKPYQPVSQGPFIYILHDTPVVLAPLISGFVGGDAFTNLVTTEYMELKKPYMIIDLGTNTEVILVTDDKVYVSSAPAGPAFEGYITSGLTPGYRGIHDVRIERVEDNGKPIFVYTGEPIGLMGSGIISLVAELLRYKLINPSGKFVKGYERYGGIKAYKIAKGEFGDIVFTQKDLREFQKALAAVKSSWRILLDIAGIDSNELKYVVLSGTFGSSLSIEDVVYLKIVPVRDKDKILVFGNSVLSGLKIYIYDGSFHEKANEFLSRIIHVNLAEYPGYMDIWIKALDLLY